MAKLFLDANDTFTVSNDVEIFGAAGGNEVVKISGTPNVQLNADVERIELADNAADYTYLVTGTQITILKDGTAVATLSGLNQVAKVAFADGSADLELTGLNAVTLGGTALPTGTAAAVVPATIDAGDTSSTSTGGGTPVAGQTFTLTTGTDTPFGTAGDDTITGTQATYTASDVIADSSSTDSDTLTITATDDITLTPTVVGIENVNFNLDAGVTAAGTGTVFNIDAANISSGTISAAVTKAATTVTSTSITNLKDGVTAATNLASGTFGAIANANLTVNMTSTSASTVADVTGTLDDLTVNASGNLTITNAKAEENIVVNGAGTVTITDLNAAATTASTLAVTAGTGITVADSHNAGDITLTATTGAVGATLTNHTDNSGSNLTASALAGDINITANDAMTGTVTLTAAGDADASASAADGDIAVESDAATAMVLSATGGISVAEAGAATSLTLTAGQDSTIENTAAAVTDITLASNNATASTPVAFTVTTGGSGLNAVDNINFAGDNDVTLAIDGTDLVVAAASTAGGTAAAAVIATDNSTATSRIEIQEATGAALDISKLAVDEIAVTVDQGSHALTVASGANIHVGADQTDLTLTAAAVPNNTVNLVVNDDDAATDANSFDLTALTTTNIATVNLALNDTEQAIAATTVGIGAANDLVVTGAGDLTIGTSITANKLDATAATGDINVQLVNTLATTFETGAGADTFTGDGTGAAYTIDGGAGVDTFVIANAGDYSAVALSLTNIEKIDVNASGAVMSAAQMTGKDYLVFGGAADTLAVNVTSATGEVVNLADITAATAEVTVTGLAGSDTIIGSAVSATTMVGAEGADTITGGSAIDTITGGVGADTLTGGAGDDVFVYDIATDGVDTYTDFDFGASGDDLQLTITAGVSDIAANNGAVTTGVDGGSVAVATIAADTAIGAASESELYVFAANGADSLTGVTATSTTAAIEAEAIIQLNDGTAATFANGNVATQGGLVLMTNDTDYFMFLVANDDTSATTGAADISLVGIFSGLDAANAHADNFA